MDFVKMIKTPNLSDRISGRNLGLNDVTERHCEKRVQNSRLHVAIANQIVYTVVNNALPTSHRVNTLVIKLKHTPVGKHLYNL